MYKYKYCGEEYDADEIAIMDKTGKRCVCHSCIFALFDKLMEKGESHEMLSS